ncbi:MAG: phytanoyl-CoA dioxygenase family protein [Verrucomicrobia bacterium]|nr:phytanoyl-CoA dioxygenase family protein [Verrucomicrobiota bacterium]
MITANKVATHVEPSQMAAVMSALETHGYCVIRRMIDRDVVESLKASIDEQLDPQGSLPQASNRYHMTFAEVSRPLWQLADHEPYKRYLHAIHGTEDLCLHRAAAILRTAGESMGTWHTDHRAHVEHPKEANDDLNRYALPSGGWFYLNGSHPERSGIAVIANSHRPDWPGPEGFVLTPDRNGFYRKGEDPTKPYAQMDVPGCVPIIADPGDFICFAARTYHANLATAERRYSCSFGFRPRSLRINAPWPLPPSAIAMIEALPERHRRYTDGYTSYEPNWRG